MSWNSSDMLNFVLIWLQCRGTEHAPESTNTAQHALPWRWIMHREGCGIRAKMHRQQHNDRTWAGCWAALVFFLFSLSLSPLCAWCVLSSTYGGRACMNRCMDCMQICWPLAYQRGWNCWQCNVLYRRGHRRVSGMGGGWLGWTMYFASSLCLCLPVDMPLQRTSIIIKHVHTHSEKRARALRRAAERERRIQ